MRTATVDVSNGFAPGKHVQCNSGEHALGGGISDPTTNVNSRVTASAPINSGGGVATAGQRATGWFAQAVAGAAPQWQLTSLTPPFASVITPTPFE